MCSKLVGDGVTDDGPALQAMIDAAGAAGGGEVRLPPGNFFCGAAYLNITRSGVSLVGQGTGATTLAWEGMAGIAVQGGLPHTDPVITGVRLAHLRLTCSGEAVAGLAGVGCIRIESADGRAVRRMLVEDCWIDHVPHCGILLVGEQITVRDCWIDCPGEHGIYVGGARETILSGIRIREPGAGPDHPHTVVAGIKLQNPGGGCLIRDCTAQGSKDNTLFFDIEGSDQGLLVTGCRAFLGGTNQIGFVVQATVDGAQVRDSFVHGGKGFGNSVAFRLAGNENQVMGAVVDGAYLTDPVYVPDEAVGNRVVGVSVAQAPTAAYAFNLGRSINTEVLGCRVLGGEGGGFRMNNCRGARLLDNVLLGAGTPYDMSAGPTDWLIR